MLLQVVMLSLELDLIEDSQTYSHDWEYFENLAGPPIYISTNLCHKWCTVKCFSSGHHTQTI